MTENYRRDFVEHLKKALLKGYKEDSLKWASMEQGYSDAAFDNAIKQAKKEISDVEKARMEAEKPKITVKIYDENNKLVTGKKPFWKRIFGR